MWIRKLFVLLGLCLAAQSAFLSDWMGTLLPVLSNQTVLDLSFPGTHGLSACCCEQSDTAVFGQIQ